MAPINSVCSGHKKRGITRQELRVFGRHKKTRARAREALFSNNAYIAFVTAIKKAEFLYFLYAVKSGIYSEFSESIKKAWLDRDKDKA